MHAPAIARDDLDAPAQDAVAMVVGIGASAGGIHALQRFFGAVPARSGMAYVVILHLSPDHESNLAEVLQAACPIPVVAVHRRVRLEPDRVYVVPPSTKLALAGAFIEVSSPLAIDERHAPIDLFFRTLARSQQGRAASIVLSGAGADGAMGMKDVKEHGGVCLAQRPEEAEFPGMPEAAIATGFADFVLAAAEMPAKLVAYQRHLASLESRREEAGDSEQALLEIFALMRQRTGHDFSSYKRSTLMRRIERRMGVRATPTLRDYAAVLGSDADEPRALLKDLLISVTRFFRDPEDFAALERTVIPQLFAGKNPGDPVRVWVAGCATGEEAYSIAMLLAEQVRHAATGPSVQVFATDIDEAALAKARAGRYTANDVADVPAERLGRFFAKDGDTYRVRRELRELVLFAMHNVIKDPPFLHLDMVTCRNLLIYLDRAAQEQVVKRFHFGLEPGGYLFLGTSESADEFGSLFVPVGKGSRVYRSRGLDGAPVMPLSETASPQAAQPAAHDDARLHERISYQEAHQRLLEQYAPPSVIVNQDFDILHLSEHAGRYLQFSGGEPSQNLFKAVRPELRLELHTALYHAVRYRVRTEALAGPVDIDGTKELVKVSVSPAFGESHRARGLLLVIFEDAGMPAHPPPDGAVPPTWHLEEELLRLRQQLRLRIEQSRVQDEEIQSVNEELTTVNQELAAKLTELSQANRETRELMESSGIAIVFLDRALRIKRFTTRACEIFDLVAADTGRPLTDITHRLDYPELAQDLLRVLEGGAPPERRVRSGDGRWYLVRGLADRAAAGQVAGVALTFTDITTALDETLRHEVEGRARAEEARVGMLRHVLGAQEKERARISRELHDQLGQEITALGLKLSLLKGAPGVPDAVRSEVETLEALARQLDSDLEFVAWELRPAGLDDLGLVDALSDYIAAWSRAFGVTARLQADVPGRLTSEVETSLYRIAQEALNNVAKHARASEVALSLERHGAQVELRVVDDGAGFEPGDPALAKSLGLVGIRERAALVGGKAVVESRRGGGTTISVVIPV